MKNISNNRRKKHFIPYLLAVFSGTLFMLSLNYMSPLLGLIAFTPFIYALRDASLKKTLGISATFGGAFGLWAFNWMLFAGKVYSGHFMYGFLGFLFSILVFVLFFMILFFLFWWITKNKLTIHSIFILAGLVAISDFGFSLLFTGFPFYYLRFGLSMTGSIYSLQLAQFGGVFILSFFTFLINGLWVYAIIHKRFPKWGCITLGLFLIINVILYNSQIDIFNTERTPQVSFNIINSNLDSPVKWDKETAKITNKMLTASKISTNSPADFNVWTETIIPWPYKKAIPFIQSLIRPQRGTGTYNLIGLYSMQTKTRLFNSVFIFNDQGEIVDRYSKRYLIKVLEEPIGDLIPIIPNEYGTVLIPGQNKNGISTLNNHLGVFICNESSTFKAIRPLVLNGSTILVNISNDSWFEGNYLIGLHFYTNRLQAVSMKRPMIISSNGGISGAINASGKILHQEFNEKLIIRRVNVFPNNEVTLFVRFPYLFPLVCFIMVLALQLYSWRKKSKMR